MPADRVITFPASRRRRLIAAVVALTPWVLMTIFALVLLLRVSGVWPPTTRTRTIVVTCYERGGHIHCRTEPVKVKLDGR